MDDERIKETIIAVIERDIVIKNYLKKECIKYIDKLDGTKDATMHNNQAKTIIKLQEQNKLLIFDLTENNKQISILKDRLKTTRKTIVKAKEELEQIRRNGNYNDLGKVISMLRDIKVGD